MDRFIDVYLHALGSDSTVLEKDYVPFLLSIDNLQHPLLCNAQCLPERSQESGDYEFTAKQFLELRLPLFQGILLLNRSLTWGYLYFPVVFSNLDRLLREQNAGNVALRIDNHQYLSKCREVFSVMRNTRTVSPSDLSRPKKETLEVTCLCVHIVIEPGRHNPTF